MELFFGSWIALAVVILNVFIGFCLYKVKKAYKLASIDYLSMLGIVMALTCILGSMSSIIHDVGFKKEQKVVRVQKVSEVEKVKAVLESLLIMTIR